MPHKVSARNEAGQNDSYLSKLHKQLAQLIETNPGSRNSPMQDKAEDPKAQPIVLVSKVWDASHFLVYRLNDDSVGIVFNDLTKLLLLADGLNIHYIDNESSKVIL